MTTLTTIATTGSGPSRQRGAATSGASLGTATLAVAHRTTRKFLRTPQLIMVGTIQGAMFILIFRYVLGGAIQTNGVSYVHFLVPGFVVTSVLFAGMSTAAGVAEDLEQSLVDRLRSLPIPRASVLAGRALADTAVLTWNLTITVAIGFAVGFALHGTVAAGLAAFGLCVLVRLRVRLAVRDHRPVRRHAQAAPGMSLLVFPLTFGRARTSRLTPCRAGCRRWRTTSRSRRWSTPSATCSSASRTRGRRRAALVRGPRRGLRAAGRRPLPADLIAGGWGVRRRARLLLDGIVATSASSRTSPPRWPPARRSSEGSTAFVAP